MRTLKNKKFEAFKQRPKNTKIVLDLSGPDGNAFAVMGLARDLARQLGYEKEDIDQLMDDMKSGDYDNLIQIFDDHFGTLVDIYGYEPEETDE